MHIPKHNRYKKVLLHVWVDSAYHPNGMILAFRFDNIRQRLIFKED